MRNVKQKSHSTSAINLRRWILKATSTTGDGKTGVTLLQIKKFLDSKDEGLSRHPEVKLALNKLLNSGHIEKVDNKYAAKNRDPPKEVVKKTSALKVKAKIVHDHESSKVKVSSKVVSTNSSEERSEGGAENVAESSSPAIKSVSIVKVQDKSDKDIKSSKKVSFKFPAEVRFYE